MALKVYDSEKPQQQNETDGDPKQPQNNRHNTPLAFDVNKNRRRGDVDIGAFVSRPDRADISSGVGNMRSYPYDGTVGEDEPLGQSLERACRG